MRKKLCSVCKKKRFTKFFNKNSWKKDGLQTSCKDCNKARSALYYKKNGKKHRKATAAIKKEKIDRNKKYVLEYLLSHPCVDCGENDPIVLEFDHVRGKKIQTICFMVQNQFSIAKIEKEIGKCQVRCALCHRRKTAKQMNWTK